MALQRRCERLRRRRAPYGQWVARKSFARVQERRQREFLDSETVRIIRCRRCNALLTQRGMCVVLLADSSMTLFSTDLPQPNAVEEQGPEKKAPHCACSIRDTHCKGCGAEVGYHVVQACVGCLDPGADNGHYWLFTVGHVAMSNRCDEGGATVEWRGLAHNASDSGAPTVFTAPVPEHLLCCICYQLLHEPMCCPCGHTFCRGCIEHELDVRRRCPLDRTPVAKADLYPNLLAQDTINGLEIRCRFGLRRVGPRRSAAAGAGADDGDAGAWEADPHGCPATVALHARQQHESDCPFRTRAGTATATPAQTAASAAACGGPCAGAPQEPPGSTASPSRRGQTCGGLDPALPHGSATSRGCAVAAPQSPPGPGGRGDAQATSCDAEVRRLVKRRFARSPSERGPSSPRGAPATGRTASPAPLPGRARLPLGAGEGQRRQ